MALREKKLRDLKNEYDRLMSIRDSLQKQVVKLEDKVKYNVEKEDDIPANIFEQGNEPKTNSKKSEEDKKFLENFLECLANSEALNKLKFSNEQMEFLSPLETETDILYKKLYKADCLACNRIKFKIEFVVNENQEKLETIQSIKIDFFNKKAGIEMAQGLSILKKSRNLHFLFAAIKQYSQLSKHREHFLEQAPNELVEIEAKEDGGYTMIIRTEKREYLTCQWLIGWNPRLHNFMDDFEIMITHNDDQLIEDVQPFFGDLCKIANTVEEAKEKLKKWDDIFKLVSVYDNKQ